MIYSSAIPPLGNLDFKRSRRNECRESAGAESRPSVSEKSVKLRDERVGDAFAALRIANCDLLDIPVVEVGRAYHPDCAAPPSELDHSGSNDEKNGRAKIPYSPIIR